MSEERAIGRVFVGGGEKGTGWAISPRHVVTALHCLQDRHGEVAEEAIAFKLPGHESAATLEAWDENSDLAVLMVEPEVPPFWNPIAAVTLAEPVEGVDFLTEGFPAPRQWPETSIPIHGRIVATSNFNRKAAAYVLFVEEVAAGRDPHGFSGAPLLVDVDVAVGSETERRQVAVGMIRWSPPWPDGRGVGYGGTVYASDLDAIAAKHRGVAAKLLRATVAAPTPKTVDRPRSRRGHRIDFGQHLERARAFFGRESLIDQIEATSKVRDRGYVHLEASAGLGKTALAAHFAVRNHAPVFFADASLGLVRAEQCLKHLSAEMIDRYGLSNQALAEESGTDATTFAAIVADVAGRHDGPLWLVVDGLDEVTEAHPGGNPLSLPRHLPANAFVLTTSREPASELEVDSITPLLSLRLSAEGADERRDLERYVLHRLQTDISLAAPVAASELSVMELARRVADAADGNFMFVTYVLADVGDGKIDIEAPPEQLAGYYERRFWSVMEPMRARSDEKWRALFKPIITSLAVAAEPVDVVWLEQQVGRPAEEIEYEVLRPWRRFLRTTEIEGKQGWLIVHRSFADFLGTKFDLKAAHRAVAETLHSHPGAYASRHLTEHLRAGDEIDALLDLVRGPAWEEAQLVADPSGGLFINDIRQVWSAVERSADSPLGQLDLEVWCLLATTSVRSRMQLIPPALLAALVGEGIWTFERARDTALQKPDPFHRARALLALATWEPTLLDDAAAAADEVPSLTRRADALREIAGSIDDDARRHEILSPFIDLPAMIDDYNGAHALARLVPVLPEALLPRAFEVARETPEGIERVVLFLALTARSGGIGTSEPIALEAFEKVGLPARLLTALEPPPQTTAAAAAAAAAIDEMEASESSGWIRTQRNDDWTLGALAPRLDLEGLRHALSFSQTLGSGFFDPTTEIAVAMARRGEALTALKALVDESPSQKDAISAVISRLSSNVINEALAMVEEIPEPYLRGEAIGALAARMPQARRQAAIVSALPQDRLGDGAVFAAALPEMAAYVETADIGRALSALSAANSNNDVAHALVAMAPRLGSEHLDHALQLADHVAYKAEDVARAAVIRQVPEASLLRTAYQAIDSEFQAATAVAVAESLGEEDRKRLLELLGNGSQPRTNLAIFGLSVYLSDAEIDAVRPLLEGPDLETLEVLRSIFPGRSGSPSATAIAVDAARLNISDEFLNQSLISLLEDGRAKATVELAEALRRNEVTIRLTEKSAMFDAEQRSNLIEVVLDLSEWGGCLRGLINLADDLDPESLRQILGALRVRDKEADRMMATADYRQLAQLQRDTSLLPLYAGLSATEREPQLAALRAQAAASSSSEVEGALRILAPRSAPVPPDIAELLYTMVNRVLHDLAFDPRNEVLSSLGDLINAVSAIGGPPLAAKVTSQVLDARDRWP